MPQRRPSTSSSKASKATMASRGNFRRRYDEAEAKRAELIARLRALGGRTRPHPGHKRALMLLNETFRRAKLAQRLAILEAAAWLIDVLERTAML